MSGKHQCIIDKHWRSSLQQVDAWVPHGSVLGSVLFLLFINDLPLFVDESYVEFYADDTKAHAAHKKQ